MTSLHPSRLGRHIKDLKGLVISGENMGLLSKILSFVATKQLDTALLFWEFELVAIAAGGFLMLLLYLFYIRYPYNKET